MKSQTIILLVVAGACGLVAMLGIKQYMEKQNNKEEVPKATVMVATAPIKPGVMLTEQHVEFKEVEAEMAPEGAVTKLEQIRHMSLRVPRGAGDWILVSQLTEELGIGGDIPTGMRVMTIDVDATMTNSGMLQPGNRIDLFVTYRVKDSASGLQKEKTVLVLEYIEVFAVDSQVYGRDTSTENAKARNISLLVDLEQVMKLTIAKRKGTISTVLRSKEDLDKSKIAEATEDILSGGQGGELNKLSTLDAQNLDENNGFVLDEEEPTIMAQLQSELTGPGGVEPPEGAEDNEDEEFWTMAIHEGGAVRVVKVNLKSDEPIDTTGAQPTGIPGNVPGSMPTGGFDLPPEFGPAGLGMDEEDLGGLEEAVEKLPELFLVK